MRTILRNRKTGHYFKGVAEWTDGVAGAFDFLCPERVVKFVLAAGLNAKEMELVFAFKDSRYNIELPLDERWGFSLSGARNSPEQTRTWAVSPALSHNATHEATRQHLAQ